MTRLVMLDGRIVPPSEAKVSVFDRGFLYGDSVFETLRTYGGAPFAIAEHMARLERSAQSVFIDLPVPLSQLTREVQHVAVEAGNAESYIRVMVTRGTGALGLDPGLAESQLRVVIVDELVSPPAVAYEEGVKVIRFETQRFGDATAAAGAKVGNYLVAVLAMREARARGAVEALIVDRDGNAIEGSTSNVFFVQGGTLITPPESAGILPGITRARVIDAARDLGLEVRFVPYDLNRLHELDEVFISSSIRELLPVSHVDDRPVGSGKPGPTTRALHRRFLEKVKETMSLRSGVE